jgi:hypothetical protein
VRRVVAAAGVVVALAAACVPDLPSDDAKVTTTRVLAVRADPAEAAPGSSVTFTALVAAPSGTQGAAPIAWSFCTAPKPITTDDAVSTACLGSGSLVAAGAGLAVTAKTPKAGCSLFGPDSPPGGFRPRDPDVTGGYYQPLRADLEAGATAFELARIKCDLANASASAASQFAAAYHVNQNPTLAPLTATLGGAPVDLAHVPAGAKVTLTASWPDAAAETYAYFDPPSQTVSTKRESMRVAWYSTDGTFGTESNGRAADDPATSVTNDFTAPSATTTVHAWVVLRDSRGGVDFAAYDLGVVQ